MLDGVGHIRIRVSPSEVRTEFVRTRLPAGETNGRKNGEVADTKDNRRRRRRAWSRSQPRATPGGSGGAGVDRRRIRRWVVERRHHRQG